MNRFFLIFVQSCQICNPEPFVDDADCKSSVTGKHPCRGVSHTPVCVHLIRVDVFRAYAIRPYKIGHALRGELGRASKARAGTP